MLEEAEWSGGSLVAAERLVRDDDTPYLPLVAYAYDDRSKRSFLTLSALEEEGRTLESIAAEARQNLARREIGLRTRADGSLVAIDEYASSMLASPEDLERIRRQLDCDAILIAAPTRGLLVALPKPPTGDHGLSRFARDSFASALEARITPLVFAWDGARLVVHRESPPEIFVSTLDELAYDAEAERLEVALVGELGPAVLRALDRLVREGRTDDGRAVAELVVHARGGAATLLSERFGNSIEVVDDEPTSRGDGS